MLTSGKNRQEVIRTKRFQFLASSDDHPNRLPFKGLLTWFDVPSDKPVGGAKGRKVIIPSSIGEPALESLVGMAVNVRSDLSGHSPTTKIGIFEKAYTGEPLGTSAVPVYVEGYLYAADFPDLVEELREQQDDLGFSYETKHTLVAERLDASEPTWEVTALGHFTGAAILYKSKAAYTKTSLAAEEETMDHEQLKQALQAMGIDVSALGSVLSEWMAFKDALSAAGGYASLSVYLNAAAEEKTKVEELTAKVDELTTALAASEEKVAALEALQASVDEVKSTVEKVAPLVDHVDTLTAEATAKAEWSRKSVQFPMTLMAQHKIEDKTDLQAELEQVDKRTDLSIEDRFALKTEIREKYRKAQ